MKPDQVDSHGAGYVKTIIRSKRSSAKRRKLMAGVIAFAAASVAIPGWGEEPAATSQPVSGQVESASPEAASGAAGGSAFKKMSLDELMDVEVSSVSRRESTVGQSPAAVAVITQEDIRRSGATSIPQALRMVPGLEVAQIDNSTWAISARGFNNNTANKLLVLMDGRSVYTPLFSGVFWDVQDTNMQDIDRIEVIRGPAGALWGANAVNGVINIITKDAKDTLGGMVTASGGTEERNFTSARYGWKLNDDTAARVYVKHFERDESAMSQSGGGHDDWMMTQAGFRIDSQPNFDNHYTVQGDIYYGTRSNLGIGDTELAGGNILGAWTHKLDNGADFRLQMYYDRTDRDIPLTFSEYRDTFDLDFQNHIPIGSRNDFTWGLGYRLTADQVDNGVVMFEPNHRTLELFSFFLQDEFQIVPDKLKLTLGSKFEHNDFTGMEIQPSARLLWNIDKRQVAWGAISRAVRTPTALEEDLQIIAPAASLIGNKDARSEEVVAYELGYRVEPTDWLSLDVATFYNDYESLRSLEFNGTIFSEENKLNGQTYGVEVGSTWKVADWWTLRGAYTYLQVQFQTDPGSTDLSSKPTEGNDPQNQVYVRSSMDFPHHIQLDCTVRYVSELANQDVPGYVAFDTRLAWQANSHTELSIVGQNLFDNQHPEFGTPGAGRRELQRGVYGMVTYRW